MRLFLFWSSVGLLIYTYFLFPLLVAARAVLRPRPHREANITPSVSVIIAAHNEEAVIGPKLDNLLSLDYPRDCLEVIVASDGSDDGTNELVRTYERQGVRLLALPRQGKAAALNAAVAGPGRDPVFGRQQHLRARRAAARPPLRRPDRGRRGRQPGLPARPGGQPGRRGRKQYWGLDRQLKLYESAAGNVISATGAIYAIRRELFAPVAEGVTDDFYTSTGVIAQGYRLVFAPQAIAYEAVAGKSGDEFGRKVRVITRGLRGVLLRRELLDPRRHGFYALQLFSHKVLRRLVAVPLLLLALVSPLLWARGALYRLATLGQALFYGLAAAGIAAERSGRKLHRLLALPAYFSLVNVAALQATLNVLRGRSIVVWEPTRATAAPEEGR